jgi:hypothetical protein
MKSWFSLALTVVACASRPPAAPPLPETDLDEIEPAQVQMWRASDPEPTPSALRTVVRRHNYLLELGPYALEVDPVDGARIVAFSLGGKNALATRGESPEAYGSLFWTSPQSDWVWPPPPELDKLAWEPSAEGDALTLKSKVDEKLGLSVEQRISADPEQGAIIIEYTLINHGAEPRKVAAWQNSRVPPGGLTFFPAAEPTLPNSTLRLEPAGGVVWYRHDPAAVRESAKAFADGLEGWLAHAGNGLLFVKAFPDVPREKQAPGEAEIEVYVHDSGRFVEVEQQGPYEEIAPGSRSRWAVRWFLRELPRDIEVKPGSAPLLDYVRKLVATPSSVESSP